MPSREQRREASAKRAGAGARPETRDGERQEDLRPCRAGSEASAEARRGGAPAQCKDVGRTRSRCTRTRPAAAQRGGARRPLVDRSRIVLPDIGERDAGSMRCPGARCGGRRGSTSRSSSIESWVSTRGCICYPGGRRPCEDYEQRATESSSGNRCTSRCRSCAWRGAIVAASRSDSAAIRRLPRTGSSVSACSRSSKRV